MLNEDNQYKVGYNILCTHGHVHIIISEPNKRSKWYGIADKCSGGNAHISMLENLHHSEILRYSSKLDDLFYA